MYTNFDFENDDDADDADVFSDQPMTGKSASTTPETRRKESVPISPKTRTYTLGTQERPDRYTNDRLKIEKNHGNGSHYPFVILEKIPSHQEIEIAARLAVNVHLTTITNFNPMLYSSILKSTTTQKIQQITSSFIRKQEVLKNEKRKNILVLGDSGCGKSSLCNLICGSNNLFPVTSGSKVSLAKMKTHELKIVEGYYLNEKDKPITIIDTIGFNNLDGDDKIIEDLVAKLNRNIDYINMFCIVVCGTQLTKFYGGLKQMIKILEKMFGSECFWKQTVIVLTHLPMSIEAERRREKLGFDKATAVYLNEISNQFPNSNGLGHPLIIDAFYDSEEDEENQAVKDALEKLWEKIESSQNCNNSKFQKIENDNEKDQLK